MFVKGAMTSSLCTYIIHIKCQFLDCYTIYIFLYLNPVRPFLQREVNKIAIVTMTADDDVRVLVTGFGVSRSYTNLI